MSLPCLDVYKKDNKQIKAFLDSLGAIRYSEFNRAFEQKEYDKIIKYMISGFPINSVQLAIIKPYLKTKVKEYPKLADIIKLKEKNFDTKILINLIVKGNLNSIKKITNLVGNDILKKGDLLLEAVVKNKIDIASYLIQNGADVNKGNPLFFTKSEKMISLLIKNGADINAILSNKTAFEYYLSYKKLHLAEALIKNGMNPNKIAESEYTPLEKVCCTTFGLYMVKDFGAKHFKLIEALFEAGASTKNLEKALYYCILYPNEKVAEYLIDKGADPFKKIEIFDSNESAYQYAKKRGSKSLVKYMKSKK